MPELQPHPQDLVITLLGSHLVERHARVWSGGMVRLLGELGFSTAASRGALARLVGRQLLARERHGRLVDYRTTARCRELLTQGDQRIFSLGRRSRSSRQWTVLWHAIPDERRLERGRLARRLRFLGFGTLQDSTWIAPHDREHEVTAVLAELDVAGQAGLMVGRPAASLDFAGFAARAWDLDDLAERYRVFVEEFAPFACTRATTAMSERDAFLVRTRLTHAFRRFPFLDPELPHDVIPPPEHRRQAVSVFHQLYRALRLPAQRHFDAVATP